MLTLFHAAQSRSGRIVWLLEELRATYAIEHVGIFRAMTGTGRPDPANLHPDGKVPALMHDGALVTESAAIALYLTDLFPEADLGAPVGSPERGAYLTWLAWTAGEMEPAYWSQIEGRTETDPLARRRYEHVNARILTALKHGPFLMGHRFTAVDVMVGGALAWGLEHAPKDDLLDAYVARVAARPANVRAMAKDAPETTEAAA